MKRNKFNLGEKVCDKKGIEYEVITIVLKTTLTMYVVKNLKTGNTTAKYEHELFPL